MLEMDFKLNSIPQNRLIS